MARIYAKLLYCSAVNDEVEIQYTENTQKTQPPITITMITCNNQFNCKHYDCFYRIDKTQNWTKKYVKAE